MPASKLTPSRILPPIVTGAATMLALLSVMSIAAQWLNGAPRIGDMIAFNPSAEPPSREAPRLVALTTASVSCALDTGTIRRSGGSFMIERPTDTAFVVHWAGPRTANDSSDCGASADLILDSRQLDLLEYTAANPSRVLTTDDGA